MQVKAPQRWAEWQEHGRQVVDYIRSRNPDFPVFNTLKESNFSIDTLDCPACENISYVFLRVEGLPMRGWKLSMAEGVWRRMYI
jgi:hypothetical protein